MKSPLPRLLLVILVFAASWQISVHHAKSRNNSPSGVPGIIPANNQPSAAPGNPGLAGLTEDLIRELEDRPEEFSGTTMEQLLLGGDGIESPLHYATRWARKDPAGFADWLRQTSAAPLPEIPWILFHQWAQKDTSSALAAWKNLPLRPGSQRARTMGAIIAGMAVANPEGARELAAAHLPLLAENTHYLFPSGFTRQARMPETLWQVMASLPDDPNRGKILAGYLNAMGENQNEREVTRRWTESTPATRSSLIANGFPGRDYPFLHEPAWASLPALILESRADSDHPGNLISGLKLMVHHQPAQLAESVSLAQEKLKGRISMEISAALITGAAEQDFPETFTFWRTLPDSILKTQTARELLKTAPEEYRREIEAALKPLPR